jgi:predicted transcriptional regulator
MGASKHIKRVLFEKDIKTADLAEKIDKPLQSLYNQLNRDTWKFAEVEKIADCLNCDVVFIDRDTKKEY